MVKLFEKKKRKIERKDELKINYSEIISKTIFSIIGFFVYRLS